MKKRNKKLLNQKSQQIMNDSSDHSAHLDERSFSKPKNARKFIEHTSEDSEAELSLVFGEKDKIFIRRMVRL